MTLPEKADRLKKLPPYVFVQIDQLKKAELAKGRKLIALGIGDPDLPTPDFIIERLNASVRKPENHQYPNYWGMIEFRRTASEWMKSRFGVTTNPDTEVLTLIGSKEGIAHLPLAFINPGDAVLVPDPAYPIYHSATLFAGGEPIPFALREENGFLPDFDELESLVKTNPRVKLIFLNYPNNPTGATASLAFFEKVVAFAKKHNIVVAHDNAYSEVYFEGKRPPSFLEVPGAMDVGVEFHSLSKMFNMTGWRVGWVAGNASVIGALAQVKTNIDSGPFNPCQEAGITALTTGASFVETLRGTYQTRRDILVPALNAFGLTCPPPAATFYVWAKLPKGKTSMQFVIDLIQKQGIVSTPGSGFGKWGEGYVRFTLCTSESTLKQVAEILRESV